MKQNTQDKEEKLDIGHPVFDHSISADSKHGKTEKYVGDH